MPLQAEAWSDFVLPPFVSVETSVATHLICALVSVPLKDGIGEAPFTRRVVASFTSGWLLSRFGPMLPPQPIDFSVWQLPQDCCFVNVTPGPVAVALPSMFGAL